MCNNTYTDAQGLTNIPLPQQHGQYEVTLTPICYGYVNVEPTDKEYAERLTNHVRQYEAEHDGTGYMGLNDVKDNFYLSDEQMNELNNGYSITIRAGSFEIGNAYGYSANDDVK